MSTRGTWGVKLPDGTTKSTYNHSDSYPSGLGVTVVDAIHEFTDEQIAEAAKSWRMVDESDKPTKSERIKYGPFHQEVSEGNDWYAYLRSAQGDLEVYLSGKLDVMIEHPLPDEEWSYLIDLSVTPPRFVVFDFDKQVFTTDLDTVRNYTDAQVNAWAKKLEAN